MSSFEVLASSYRDSRYITNLVKHINQRAKSLCEPIHVMEVCGGHTHAIMKYGLNQLLTKNIKFIHGPGCPVCIMPKERIDHAVILAKKPNTILVTLGDMIRVPGSKQSLAQCRAEGGSVEAVYDPLDTLEIARQHPDCDVVFFAIGFETTTPMTAVLVRRVLDEGLGNVYFHINHVVVPPAMDAVLASGDAIVNAFIAPSHVSAITGYKIYQPIVDKYSIPLVVAGFEPIDILLALEQLVEMKLEGRAELGNQYDRVVTEQGNLHSQQLVDTYFEPRPSFNWRGLGEISHSALRLREAYSLLDAEKQFAAILPQLPVEDLKKCCCGEILKGLKSPCDCVLFGKSCKPTKPIGSCMVSSEGACNAYYRYASVLES